MLLISSWINTVLPTPAPPNKPILPPLMYGANKSTTLIPVSKISTSVESSSNLGASDELGHDVQRHQLALLSLYVHLIH